MTNLSAAKLATAYNALAAALGLDHRVNKFADRATAEKRVGDLVAKLEAAGKVVTLGEDGAATVADEPKPAPVAATAPKPAKSGANNAGPRASVADDDVIQVLVEGNPKKALAARRFDQYAKARTVGGYTQAIQGIQKALGADARRQALRDIAWDVRQGWIRVVGAKQAAREEAKAAAVAKAA